MCIPFSSGDLAGSAWHNWIKYATASEGVQRCNCHSAVLMLDSSAMFLLDTNNEGLSWGSYQVVGIKGFILTKLDRTARVGCVLRVISSPLL